MKNIVFTDLDETLFSSGDIGEPATVDKYNQYHSFCSLQKRALLNLFEARETIVVPVTGRNTESISRCILKEVVESEYAIVSHGMLILDSEKKPLRAWLDYLYGKYNFDEWETKIENTYNSIIQDLSYMIEKVNVKIILDNGMTSHLSIKLKKEYYDSEILADISSYLKNEKFIEFKFHENNRTFALLPPFCNKAKAVMFLNKMISNDCDLVFSIGDSTTDIAFMKQADYMIVPKNTQISRGIND